MTIALSAEGLRAGYGRIEVLHGIDVVVPDGSVVAVLGPNGVGKTTLLRALAGALPAWGGAVRLGGRRIDGLPAFRVARMGLALIPEGHSVFPGLTVRENIAIAARDAGGLRGDALRARVASVLEMFPRLGELGARSASTLSGGEQQMLALSRAFLADPRVLLIDEISRGLAPIVVDALFDAISALKRRGLAVVLVEQYLSRALRLADIVAVMAKGRVVFTGEPSEVSEEGVLVGGESVFEAEAVR